MAYTECRPLEVTVISAKDLENVRDFLNMHPYVVASLCGDQRYQKKQRTPVREDGGTSPCWNHALADTFTVDVAGARAGHLTLKLVIKTKRAVKVNKPVGSVDVPVGELLKQGGDGKPKEMSYAVKPRGVLKFSYKFGQAFTVHRQEPDQPLPDQQPSKKGKGLLGAAVIVHTMANLCGDLLDVDP